MMIALGKVIFKAFRLIGLNVAKDGTIFVNCAKTIGRIIYELK